MGAVLDRNGLRPSRYYITDDDRLILSSEVGVLEIPAEHILKKERLHPGKMLLVDTVKGEVLTDEEIKETYAKREPYGEWLDSNLVTLHELKIPNERIPSYSKEERARLQKAFGYTYEEYREGICSMALNGTERIGAMGVDTAGCPFQRISAVVLLFQAAVRTGNEPSDRCGQGKNRHFHNRICRQERKSSGREAGKLPGTEDQ